MVAAWEAGATRPALLLPSALAAARADSEGGSYSRKGFPAVDPGP